MGFDLFGRSYESVGKESADFCIKTKGKVKIKWGNKYIDLIKDGEINVDAKFIFRVKDEDSIGSQTGIYVTDENMVYVKVGDILIPIYGDTEGSDYVAYILQDGKTGEQKMFSQKNIGISFDTFDALQASGIKDGMAFVKDNGIYMIKGGVVEKLEFKLENPMTEPLIIKIAGGDYALLLDGYMSTTNTQLVIGSTENGIRIYAENDGKYIDVPDSLNITIDGTDVFTVKSGQITSHRDIHITNNKSLITDNVKNQGGSETDGYLLTMKDGESWLYLDNLVLRNDIDNSVHVTVEGLDELIASEGLTPGAKYTIDDYQNEWDLIEQRTETEEIYDDEDGPMTGINFQNVFPLTVTAKTESTLTEDAKFTQHPQWDLKFDFTYRVPLYTETDEDGQTETTTAMGRITWMRDEFGNECDYDFKHLRFLIDGKLQFTFQGEVIGNTGVMSDGSLTGDYRNNKIGTNTLNIERRAAPNESGITYVLGTEGNVIQIKKPISNNTIGIIDGKLTIDTEKCKGNSIISTKVKELEIIDEFNGNNITVDTIDVMKSKKLFNKNRFTGTGITELINEGTSRENSFYFLKMNKYTTKPTGNINNNLIHVDTITELLIGDLALVEKNKIVSNTLTKFEATASFMSNDIEAKTINTITAKKDILRNIIKGLTIGTIRSDEAITDNEIYASLPNLITSKGFSKTYVKCGSFDFNSHGMTECRVLGSIANCSFDDMLKNATFHSSMDGLSLYSTTYPYLYNTKIVDVYINEGSVRHICMPDTVFPGMIVMYDGRKPIPTGWVLCDGKNGTLNLLDKFVKFGSTAGVTGGSTDGMIEIKHLPTNNITTQLAGNHYHTYTAPKKGMSDNANDRDVMEFSESGNTSTAGNHVHTLNLNSGTQERFEPPFNTVIPIMYIGG